MTTDARGRVRVPVERREALLDEFERSGLSGVKFAQMVGVKYSTFALWVQKRRKARKLQGAGETQAVTFAEAVVDRGAGVIRGERGGLTITATIETLGDGRIQVKFGSKGDNSLDPGLIQRVSDSYDRRMGR